MYSSSNTDDPFESLFKTSTLTYDQNPSSVYDELLRSFPSPFLDNHDQLPLSQISTQNHPIEGNIIEKCIFNGDSADQIPEEVNSTQVKKRKGSTVPRKRMGKKDRHSKICTAQGIRDRRMRLSVQVARKFFDLQDMLGYDKASKTIDWLFAKSKKAIKELSKNHDDQAKISSSMDNVKSESFASECEVASRMDKNSNTIEIKGVSAKSDDMNYNRKVVWKPNIRESWDMARARAREKAMIKRLDLSQWQKSNPNNQFQELGFSPNSFEGVEVSSPEGRKRDSPYHVDSHLNENQLVDEGTIEKFLGATTSLTSCPSSDYQCCGAAVSGCIGSDSNFMGFWGDCQLSSDHMFNCNDSELENMVSFAGNPTSYFTSDFLQE